MAEKAWWEIILLFIGTLGGLKAIVDMARSFWFSRPKLEGVIEVVRVDSDPTEIVKGGHYAYLAAFVRVVNTRPQKTSVESWDLHVEISGRQRRKLRSVPASPDWGGVQTEYLSANALEDRHLVFERNIQQKSWFLFPFDELFDQSDNPIVRTIIATDARGKEHVIKGGPAVGKAVT